MGTERSGQTVAWVTSSLITSNNAAYTKRTATRSAYNDRSEILFGA
ncbi:MAG: hypothetical protein ACLR56_03740 [Oscillospiraceae bacterium]